MQFTIKRIIVFLVYFVVSGDTALAGTISNWPRDTSVSCVGEECGPAYVGELFQALPGFASTATLGFELNRGSDMDFRVLLATTTPLEPPILGGSFNLERRPDKLLYASPKLTLPLEATNQSFTVDLGGTDLVDNDYYALIIDTFEYFNGEYAASQPFWTAQDSGFKPQPEAIFFAFAYPTIADLSGTNISDHFLLEPTLGRSIGGDLAFEIVFDMSTPDETNPELSFLPMPDPTIGDGDSGSVPEPTTLTLLGLGLAGIGYRRYCSKTAA